MIESVVLPSLSSDLITITELLTEESSPGLWYCIFNRPPVYRYGSEDWYEEVWIEGWI